MIDVKQVSYLIGELEEDEVISILNDFVASNPTEEEARKVVEACQEGMSIVGELFEKGQYFVGDLIFAGELLTEAIDILRPAISGERTNIIGKIVIGTVHGDLHDIGKNIFKGMAEAAGFDVYDIGIDQSVDAFIDKVKEVKPDILGLSGVLTLALESMKDTVDGLKEAGLRENIKIVIGGNPVTEEASINIGADAFTTNSAEGVKICRSWV